MKVIANPTAGRNGERAIGRVCRLLEKRGIGFDLARTRAAGDATRLARESAAAGCARVLSIGGDGTISEIANGLAVSPVELGIVSVGTGNDFARSLGLPYNDVEAATEIAISGRARPVDIGREKDRFFISGLGVGFPSLVAERSARTKWLGGPARFAWAVYQALREMRPISVEIELDGVSRDLECTSILVQNTRFTGGGLLVAPDARLDDGLFDVVIVGLIGRIDLALNYPRVYRGTHGDHPAFSVCQARRVRIESRTELRKMFDGDLFGCSPLEAEVVSGGIRVIVGQDPASVKRS